MRTKAWKRRTVFLAEPSGRAERDGRSGERDGDGLGHGRPEGGTALRGVYVFARANSTRGKKHKGK